VARPLEEDKRQVVGKPAGMQEEDIRQDWPVQRRSARRKPCRIEYPSILPLHISYKS
jgi:hypothetical protein